MADESLIEGVQADLEDLAKQGQTVVSIPALQQYLTGLTKLDPGSAENLILHKLTARKDLALVSLRIENDVNLEMLRSVLSSAHAAVNSSMLINGGAAAALLAFIGHLVAQSPGKGLAAAFAVPMIVFVGGVFLAALAGGLTYLTQYAYHHKSKGANLWRHLTKVVVVLSYSAFVAGGWLAFERFRAL